MKIPTENVRVSAYKIPTSTDFESDGTLKWNATSIVVVGVGATRCTGVTGALQAGIIAHAHHVDISGHTAPALHAHVMGALPNTRHIEYFWDHVRIENIFCDGRPEPRDGKLCPDLGRAGLGLELKHADIEQYRVG